MKIQIKILTILFLSLFSCNTNKNYEKISDEINKQLLNNRALYDSLTTDYKFKIFKDGGIGKDYTKPLCNDTIIILKDNFTKNINLSRINHGKTLLLDSIELCSLSFAYDDKRKVMRYFLKITYNIKSNEIILNKKSWVPQYLEVPKCIEIEW